MTFQRVFLFSLIVSTSFTGDPSLHAGDKKKKKIETVGIPASVTTNTDLVTKFNNQPLEKLFDLRARLKEKISGVNDDIAKQKAEIKKIELAGTKLEKDPPTKWASGSERGLEVNFDALVKARRDNYEKISALKRKIKKLEEERGPFEAELEKVSGPIESNLAEAKQKSLPIATMIANHEREKVAITRARLPLSESAEKRDVIIEIDRLFQEAQAIGGAIDRCRVIESSERAVIDSESGIKVEGLVIAKESRVPEKDYAGDYLKYQASQRFLSTQNAVPSIQFEDEELKILKSKWEASAKLSPNAKAWAAASLLSFNAYDIGYVQSLYQLPSSSELSASARRDFMERVLDNRSIAERQAVVKLIGKENEGDGTYFLEDIKYDLSLMTRSELVEQASIAAEAADDESLTLIALEFNIRKKSLNTDTEMAEYDLHRTKIFDLGAKRLSASTKVPLFYAMRALAKTVDQRARVARELKRFPAKDRRLLMAAIVGDLEAKLFELRMARPDVVVDAADFNKVEEPIRSTLDQNREIFRDFTSQLVFIEKYLGDSKIEIQKVKKEAIQHYDLVIAEQKKQLLQTMDVLETQSEFFEPSPAERVRLIIDLGTLRLSAGEPWQVVQQHVKEKIRSTLKLDRGEWGDKRTSLEPERAKEVADYYVSHFATRAHEIAASESENFVSIQSSVITKLRASQAEAKRAEDHAAYEKLIQFYGQKPKIAFKSPADVAEEIRGNGLEIIGFISKASNSAIQNSNRLLISDPEKAGW
jgi:hypothetical protein